MARNRTAGAEIISATSDGIVTFRGEGGKPVEWLLSRIRAQTDSCEDPNIRAEWADLAKRGQRAVVEAASAERDAESQSREARAYRFVARMHLEQTRGRSDVARAVSAYWRNRCETTFEALVRATADALSAPDAEARSRLLAAQDQGVL